MTVVTGTDIVATLLRANGAIVAKVKIDQLPDDAPLPSILLRSISEVERVKLKRAGYVRVTERIEIMVRAASVRDVRPLRILARDTCAGWTGDIGDARSISITNAGAGPDLTGPNHSFQRAQDLRVSYETPV